MKPQEIDYALLRLNDRLKRVEEHLGLRPLPSEQVSAPAEPAQAHDESLAAIRQTVQPQPPTPVIARPGNWLGIAAVVCFVVAAGFIVKMSIESGWLTPPRQIGLAALLGLVLIGAGLALRRADREYAGLLPAAGVVVLYLTAFAAHSLYSLLPFDVAIGVVCIVSAICLWLYTELKHDLYAITAAVGAYLSPVILDLHGEAEFALYYFLCCSVAFAALSIWLRTRTLTLVSAYLALLLTAVLGSNFGNDALVAGVLAVHFVIFAASTWLYTRESRRPLTDVEAWSFLPVLIAFYALEYQLLDRLVPLLAPWLSLSFAALLIGLYLAARKVLATHLASQSLVLTYATIVAFHSGYLELLPDPVKPWLFVAVVLGIAFSPPSSRPKGALWVPVAAAVVIAAIEYLKMLTHLFGAFDAGILAVSAAAFASLWALILRGGQQRLPAVWSYALLGLAHLLAILGFYRLTAGAGSLAVSASWLFYAVAVIVFAFMRKDEAMAKSALVILALAAGKALLYDAASAPTLVRIFCLLLTGAVLYGCGLLMRKIAVWGASKAP
jgi:uncharacterized membrane protein